MLLKKGLYCLAISCCSIVALFSCNKNDSPGPRFPEPTDSVQRINRWILDSMYYYYYWNNSISSGISLAGKPADFFRSLLSSNDPYSWISDGRTTGPARSCFDYYGFHYLLVTHPAQLPGKLLGVITLAAPESAADKAGLTRGIYFSKVNNAEIGTSNISVINDLLKSGNSVKLTLVRDSSGTWKENGVVTLTASFFEERPVYRTALFEKGGKKTGYLFYNAFDELFDADVLNAFSRFKAENITELILDLRYNPGGSVASAAKLSALIGNVNNNDVFAIYKGNSNLKTINQSFEKAINVSANSIGKNFADLQANRVSISRVFILSTGRTASAAEMMINNLKAYVPVVQIGETTLGKDMAGVVIRDLRQPKQVQWFMQPLVFKLYNARDKGDYDKGLTPEHVVKEFEWLPLAELGSSDDELIKKALVLIYGSNQVVTEVLRKNSRRYRMTGRSVMYNSMGERGNDGRAISVQLPR